MIIQFRGFFNWTAIQTQILKNYCSTSRRISQLFQRTTYLFPTYFQSLYCIISFSDEYAAQFLNLQIIPTYRVQKKETLTFTDIQCCGNSNILFPNSGAVSLLSHSYCSISVIFVCYNIIQILYTRTLKSQIDGNYSVFGAKKPTTCLTHAFSESNTFSW